MSEQRRTFSAEFKREAAALVLDQGYSHLEAYRSLGVVDSALRRWVKQLQQERDGITPAEQGAQQKLQELEARINRLEREPVKMVCSAFDVARSCYYAYRSRRHRVDIHRLALRSQINNHGHFKSEVLTTTTPYQRYLLDEHREAE